MRPRQRWAAPNRMAIIATSMGSSTATITRALWLISRPFPVRTCLICAASSSSCFSHIPMISCAGKTIMVPRYASGVWWSRWFDVNNKDVLDIAEAYESNRIPLDVFVIDMDVRCLSKSPCLFTMPPHICPFICSGTQRTRGVA